MGGILDMTEKKRKWSTKFQYRITRITCCAREAHRRRARVCFHGSAHHMRERIMLISTAMHCFSVPHWAALPCAITFASCLPEMNCRVCHEEGGKLRSRTFASTAKLRAFRTQTELHYEWVTVCLLHSNLGLVRGGCPVRLERVKTWEWMRVERWKAVAQRLNAIFIFVFSCVTYVFSGEDAGRPGKAGQAASFGTAAQMRLLLKFNCAGDEVGRQSVCCCQRACIHWQVRTGGKGTVRRKKKAVHKTATTDDKRLQVKPSQNL